MERGMQYAAMPLLRRPRCSWGLPHAPQGPKKDTDLKSQTGIQSSLTTAKGPVITLRTLPSLSGSQEWSPSCSTPKRSSYSLPMYSPLQAQKGGRP